MQAMQERIDRARQAMLIGYARVSTQDQNLELQREASAKAGCQKVFEDKVSGTRAERPGLAKALEMLRDGDTLVVWKLDRLGRSVKQLVDLVGELHKQGVQFKSLTDAIDTGTPSGRFFFHVMASLAEMERELTVERTRAGLEVARQLGRKGGRKPKVTDSRIEAAKRLLASGVPAKDVARNLGVSIPGRRGLAQPAVKCRGREYLRIIYGPEYTAPENLERLRHRGLSAKRSLALREFALGIEALERFVRREPLRR